MRITVAGVGYVGLVAAACLAEGGNHVVCVDTDADKIANLDNGIIPIYEPGLGELVRHNVQAGRLTFTTDLKAGVDQSLIIILAVGTPSAADGSADISAVLAAGEQIAEVMTDYRIVVTKSTVPVGTHQKVAGVMAAKTKHPFDYVSNPEFLKEGAAVDDFMKPDRVIIGTASEKVRKIMKQLYAPFMRQKSRMLFMDPASAELTKYAANSMLATRISFMNEMSRLCETFGADVEMVRMGMGSDSRIGSAFLFPGVGYGGSCFPKDVRALIHMGQVQGCDMSIARAVQQANATQHDHFSDRVLSYFADKRDDSKVSDSARAPKDCPEIIAVWGLAFKAKTDDIRESPAVHCIERFLDAGMTVRAYDPEAMKAAEEQFGDRITTDRDSYGILDGADALVIFTDWQEFRSPDFEMIAERLRWPVIFDGRNLYDPVYVASQGIEYYSIGRPGVGPEVA